MRQMFVMDELAGVQLLSHLHARVPAFTETATQPGDHQRVYLNFIASQVKANF
jgi:hypothetical protein